MSQKIFHVLGAFDRFNYGDVLFAQIARRLITENFPDAEILFYGTHESDLTDMGGVVTRPMRDLYRQIGRQTHPVDNVILVAGGEVLAAPWHLMYEHAMSLQTSQWLRRLRYRVGPERMDWLFQMLSRCPSVLPWLPDPDDIKTIGSVTVIYNSVGGNGVGLGYRGMTEWQRSALPKACWLSVRDRDAVDRVAALGLPKPRLSPDSAVLMAGMQSIELLQENRDKVWRRMQLAGLSENSYFSLQCGIKYFSKHEGILVDQVQSLHAQYGLPIIGFAIGRAAGHEDQITARRLSNLLGHPSWFHQAPEDMTIWEIMSLIAGSACYMGSSLHGYITAFAFAKPRVGLATVKKITGFRDAWDHPTMPVGIEFSEICQAVTRALMHDRGAMQAQANTIVRHYQADVAEMWSSLCV